MGKKYEYDVFGRRQVVECSACSGVLLLAHSSVSGMCKDCGNLYMRFKMSVKRGNPLAYAREIIERMPKHPVALEAKKYEAMQTMPANKTIRRV